MSQRVFALSFVMAILAASIHGQGGKGAAIHVTSPAFTEGKPIPSRYTCDGKDVSPPIRWDNAPSSAKTFALICEDPDAPSGTWVHWMIYNISADTTSLPERVMKSPELIINWFQCVNDFGKFGYNGPCPPNGKAHRYFFKVYALDASISLPMQARKADFAKAMEGHIVAEGSLMGTYQR